MKVKTFLLTGFFLLVFSMSFVLATNTEINIKTLPNHKVSIFILGTEGVYSLLDSYHIQTDSSGLATVSYSGSKNEVKIKVKITKNGDQKMLEDLGTFTTGSPLYLQVKPNNISLNYKVDEEAAKQAEEAAKKAEEAVKQAEEQAIAQEAQENQTKEEGITGWVTNITDNFNFSYMWYGLGALLVIFGLVGCTKVIKKIKKPGKLLVIGSKDKEEGEYQKINEVDTTQEKRLANAERKIKEAQAEINSILSKDKEMEDAERKFKEAKKRLENLRSSQE